MVGQMLLVVGGVLFQMITRYDVHKAIGDDHNVAAGISFGGFLAAIGFIVRGGLAGATSNISEEIATTIVVAGVGMILLVFARIIADKVFLPEASLSKEVADEGNPAAAGVAAACFICVAVMLATSINP